MKKIFTLIIGILSFSLLTAISLEDLETQLIKNHPISQKEKIFNEINKIEKSKILKEILPQFSLNVNTTWQSETISLPINNPTIKIPEVDKDRETITLNVNQLVFDAGINKEKRKLAEKTNQTNIQSTKVTLHKLTKILRNLYYAVLIQKDKIKLDNLNLENIKDKENIAEKAVKFGILTPKEVWILQKEILSIQQKIDENQSKLEYLINEISILTNVNISNKEKFLLPTPSNKKYFRPELSLFRLKKETLKINSYISYRAKYPKLFAFAQFGYGKPGLNSFSTDWSDYQVYGINFKWDIWNWKKYSSKQKIINKKIKLISSDENSFKLSLKMKKEESQQKIKKLEKQIIRDNKIIKLDKKILDSIENKFKNGTETAANIVIYTNSYYAAKIQKRIREIELNYERNNLNKNIGVIK